MTGRQSDLNAHVKLMEINIDYVVTEFDYHSGELS